jgi:hypothetical protein
VSAALDKILELTSRMAGVGIDTSQFNELDVARAIRDGTLPSPQRFANLLLISLRVTGTGSAFRAAHQEFVWRSPDLYLTPEFLERCQGLPVVWEHPEGNALNSEEFSDRIIGTLALPFIKGEEIWAIAKIYDSAAAKALETQQLSTSPAVVFKSADAAGSKIRTPDGSTVLIENEPYLLDSLAICPLGVWDKSGPPAGVDNSISEVTSFSIGDTDTMACTNQDLQRQIDALRHRIGAPLCEEMRSEFAAAQSKADKVAQAFGDSAPPWLAGERFHDYRVRLASKYQPHSTKFKGSELCKIRDPVALSAVEDEIYGDALRSLRDPSTVPHGQLREIKSQDPTRRTVSHFVGAPGACWNRFKPAFRYVKRWGDEKTGQDVF